jgi:hypothetical protein
MTTSKNLIQLLTALDPIIFYSLGITTYNFYNNLLINIVFLLNIYFMKLNK